jgi:GNAT superfamily N-acetyltransferase
MPFTLAVGIPTSDEYRRLRVTAGLSPKSAEATARGLPNTLHGVTIRDGETLMAMGRIVGDGGCFFQLVDIAVDPRAQGQGLGKRIMAALTEQLRQTAPEGAYVSLIADGDARHLYAQFDFAPNAPASIGMVLDLGVRDGSRERRRNRYISTFPVMDQCSGGPKEPLTTCT